MKVCTKKDLIHNFKKKGFNHPSIFNIIKDTRCFDSNPNYSYWNWVGDMKSGLLICNNCNKEPVYGLNKKGEEVPIMTPYCPNCGAKMVSYE